MINREYRTDIETINMILAIFTLFFLCVVFWQYFTIFNRYTCLNIAIYQVISRFFSPPYQRYLATSPVFGGVIYRTILYIISKNHNISLYFLLWVIFPKLVCIPKANLLFVLFILIQLWKTLTKTLDQKVSPIFDEFWLKPHSWFKTSEVSRWMSMSCLVTRTKQ